MLNDKQIWMLTYAVNDYDQHGSYPIAVFEEKPTFTEIARFIGVEFPSKDDNETLLVTKVWEGEETTHEHHDISYLLEKIGFGDDLR